MHADAHRGHLLGGTVRSMTSREDLAALTTDPIAYLDDPDPEIRRLAVTLATATDPRVDIDDGIVDRLLEMMTADASPRVRAEAAEALGNTAGDVVEPLLSAASADDAPIVVEAAATALGEIGDRAAVPWLIDAAAHHPDRLVREAAVASLGAIGDERARITLLDLVANGPPQIRRRSVAALTVFDGDDVETALRAALADRNPMVREAAEMVMGRPVPEAEDGDPS
jgi:HEAT repeat protein